MDPIICTFDEFVDHIKNRLKDVSLQVEYNDHLYSEEEYPKLKALVVDAASKMEHDISKLHLLFSNITLPALISLLKDIESVFVHIVESARLFMSCGLTNAAREEILFDIEEITISIENLVDNCKKVYTKQVSKLSPSCTGAVWDACKRLNSISESNKKACLKEVMTMIRMIRDVRKEHEEYSAEDDDWDGLLDEEDCAELEDEAPSKELQEATVRQITKIQLLFESLFKLYSKALPAVIPFDQVEKLNDVSVSLKTVCKDVDSFGMVLYGLEEHDRNVILHTGDDIKSLQHHVELVCNEGEECRLFREACQEAMESLAQFASLL